MKMLPHTFARPVSVMCPAMLLPATPAATVHTTLKQAPGQLEHIQMSESMQYAGE